MREIALAIECGTIPGIEMAGVIASRPDAAGIEKARELRIPYDIVDPRTFRQAELTIDREAFGLRLLDVLKTGSARPS